MSKRTASDPALQLALTCAEIVSAKKAEDIVLLKMGKLIAICDYFLIASGNSSRQLKLLADELLKKLKELKEKPLSVEGLSDPSWILIDTGSLVIHLFKHDTRKYYDLEFLWSEAPRIPLKKKLSGLNESRK